MRLKQILKIFSEMGLSWIFYRGLYYIYRRSGMQKLFFPHRDIDWVKFSTLSHLNTKQELMEVLDTSLSPNTNPDQLVKFYSNYVVVSERIQGRYDEFLKGQFQFFSKLDYELSNPPEWFLNPSNGKLIDSQKHWTQIGDFNTGAGDIKFIWEMSRFSIIYDLVRCYVLTNDEGIVRQFWKIINDWIDKNPTELGPHWKCGQEIAMRSIAWLFGLRYFYRSQQSSVNDILKLCGFIRYNARHIEKNFWYAHRCVRNNHTISEASGIFTIGILLPFLPESKRWVNKEKKMLEREGLRQIYDDGTYLQQSHNYHRLVIQLYSWCIYLGKRIDISFSQNLLNRLRKSVEFLYNLQDRRSGMLPNSGNNDGALLQPLSDCDFLDYRPQLQTAYYLLTNTRLYSQGVWDENTLWFISEEGFYNSNMVELRRENKRYPIGGYYVLRENKNDCFGVIKCASYKDRPVQADMLHFDFWCNGKNILCDPGIYSYNTLAEMEEYFIGAKAHNTVTVNDKDQMFRFSKFLWSSWLKADMKKFKTDNDPLIFEGEYNLEPDIIHKRTVLVRGNLWWIRDEIRGEKENALINWNINAENINTGSGFIVINGDYKIFLRTDYSVKKEIGYVSNYYGYKEQITCIRGFIENSRTPILFNTFISIENDISKESISSLENLIYR